MFNKEEHITNSDKLLKEAFLNLDFDDPKNATILQSMADSVMISGTLQTSKPTNSIKELISKINLQSILLISLAIAGLTIGISLFINSDVSANQKAEDKIATDQNIENKSTSGSKESSIETSGVKYNNNTPQQKMSSYSPNHFSVFDVFHVFVF